MRYKFSNVCFKAAKLRTATKEICEWFDDVMDEQVALLQNFSQLATLKDKGLRVLEANTPEDEETRRRVDQLTRVVDRLALASEEQEQKMTEVEQELKETKENLVIAKNELANLRERQLVS